jgi:hypothetical protein
MVVKVLAKVDGGVDPASVCTSLVFWMDGDQDDDGLAIPETTSARATFVDVIIDGESKSDVLGDLIDND